MVSMSHLVWRGAETHRDAPCVCDDSRSTTYGEFAALVDAFAVRLAREGVTAGDTVAVMLPNRVELVVTLMAAWRLRAVATPVNPAFTPDEARHQLRDSGAVLVVTDRDRAEALTRHAGNAGPRALTVDDVDPAPGGSHVEMAEPNADDLALLVYTSGSTGRPKGVEITHSNLAFMTDSFRRFLDLIATDHCLLVLPLFHVNAICISVLAPLSVGGRVSISSGFSPERFLGEIERLRPTYFSAVPTIYALCAAQSDADDRDTSSLRVAICGAAPASKELLARAEKMLGAPVLEGYGLTEATCASACNPPDRPRKPGTVGPALPGQRIDIVSTDGTTLPAGSIGEVVISGPTVMRGYHGLPDATRRTVIDGRLHTGDVGVLDEDGYLTLVDRIKDMIIRGGENLYPKEIENALATHPGVLECAVVGAPDDTYGEVPVAYAVLYPRADVAGDDLRTHIAERLTRVKIPRAVRVVDSLPRNPVGKIDKPELRRIAAAEASAATEASNAAAVAGA